jgi:hypothetical protein
MSLQLYMFVLYEAFQNGILLFMHYLLKCLASRTVYVALEIFYGLDYYTIIVYFYIKQKTDYRSSDVFLQRSFLFDG